MLAQVVLFDGFHPLDVIAPFEVLVAAAYSPTTRSPWSWSRPRGPARCPVAWTR
jgi:putative intracellular protease/amidase